jgi:hypothetical protein
MDKDLEFDEEVSTHSIRSKLNESLLTDEVLTIFLLMSTFITIPGIHCLETLFNSN